MKPKLEIRKSVIAGKGVFADEMIRKGQTVYFLNGEPCSLEEMIKRVNEGKEEPSDPLGIDDGEYLDLDEVSRTFNHSCDPNTYVRGKNELIAMRDITEGEEITYDYSTTMNDDKEKIVNAGRELWTCECNCKGKNCRGIINQFIELPKGIREYYINNRYMPDFMLRVFG